MENTAEVTKMAIIEDQRELREGFSTLINFTPGFSCSGVKYSTIKFHMQIIYDKLQVHSKSGRLLKR